MRRFAGILLSLTVTVACNSQKAIPLPSGEWTLTTLNGEDASGFKRPVTLQFNTESSKAAGFAGCNQYFSSYTLKENTLQFKGIGSTKMFCEDAMDVENKFLETLGRVNTYRLEENKLTFLKGDSVLLEFKPNP